MSEERSEEETALARFVGHGVNPTYGGTPLSKAQEAALAVMGELDDTRAEVVHLAERIEWLTGKWEQANERCPQCGNGLRGSPFVAQLIDALTRIAEWKDSPDDAAGHWMRGIALSALEHPTYQPNG